MHKTTTILCSADKYDFNSLELDGKRTDFIVRTSSIWTIALKWFYFSRFITRPSVFLVFFGASLQHRELCDFEWIKTIEYIERDGREATTATMFQH